MNSIKRFAGILWIILGPVAIFYLIKTAAEEITKKTCDRYKDPMDRFYCDFYSYCNRSYDLWLVCPEK